MPRFFIDDKYQGEKHYGSPQRARAEVERSAFKDFPGMWLIAAFNFQGSAQVRANVRYVPVYVNTPGTGANVMAIVHHGWAVTGSM